jgi:hypothetical protein
MLCMSDRTEHFCTVTMFITSYKHLFIASIHTSTIYLCTGSHMPNTTGSLGIAISLGVKQSFYTASMSLFAILQKHYLNKCCIIFPSSVTIPHFRGVCCHFFLMSLHTYHVVTTDSIESRNTSLICLPLTYC